MCRAEEILVSICCITYNHEKYIAEAIESFLMQKTSFNYEILIHDDASTDRTAEIIKEYEEKYPDIIKPIYQKENQFSQGKSVAKPNYNRAQGKYVALCEGDDYWTDSFKLQKQVDYMENHPKCSMTFHTVSIYDDKLKKITDKVMPYRKNCISKTEDIILGDGGFIGTNSIVLKKEIVQNLPNFYKKASIADYLLQILGSIYDYAYFIKDEMSVYRVNIGTSWSDKNKDKNRRKNHFIKMIEVLEELNEYTNRKYEKVIKKRISRWCFRLLKWEIRDKNLSLEEYEFLYNRLEILKEIELYLKRKLKKI